MLTTLGTYASFALTFASLSPQLPLAQRATQMRWHTKQAHSVFCQQLAHLVTPDGYIKKVLFAPKDPIRQTLIDLIDLEQKGIKIAMYTFTDLAIAQALIRAHQRNIPIEIVVDPTEAKSKYSKMPMLCEKKVAVLVFPRNKKEFFSTKMHNKFSLFRNIARRPIVCTGSYNFTDSASKRNQENILIMDDPEIIEQYQTEFQELEKASIPYEMNTIKYDA